MVLVRRLGLRRGGGVTLGSDPGDTDHSPGNPHVGIEAPDRLIERTLSLSSAAHHAGYRAGRHSQTPDHHGPFGGTR